MKAEIIAELAQSYEGNFEISKLLLKAAKSSGADSAKFQIVFADELATKDYEYYDLFRSLEMKDSDWLKLNKLAKTFDINLYADIFGLKSLKLAEKMNLRAVKVHGTDISNEALLETLSQSKIPRVLLGLGGAYKKEISRAVEILKNKKINLMLGFQSYPTPNNTNQISRILLLRKLFNNVEIGFADHSNPEKELSYILPLIALTLGANTIEKHLTLGKSMEMEDFESALNPDEFKIFVNLVKQSSKAYGKYKNKNDFGMSVSELSYRKIIRRDVVSKKKIKKGDMILSSHLSLKRSSDKNAIKNLDIVLGKKALRDIKKNTPLTKRDFE